jgi:hypothetical protein
MGEKDRLTENVGPQVEDDMTYGVWSPEGHWHYLRNFDLGKVEDPEIRDLITKESKLPRKELERRFRSLAKATSKGVLETSNLALIDHFLNSNDTDKSDFLDPSGTLTQKVFEHKTTKVFIEGIKKKTWRGTSGSRLYSRES